MSNEEIIAAINQFDIREVRDINGLWNTLQECRAALESRAIPDTHRVASMPQDVELNQILGEYLTEELAAVAPDIDWYDGRYMDGLVSGILDVVMAGHARVPGDMLYLLPQADALDDIWACAHSGYSVEDLKIKIEMLKGQDNE